MVTPGDFLHLVGDAQLDPLGVEFGLLLVEIFLGALLQFTRGVVVEALDLRELLLVDRGKLLDRAEAFGGEQLADDFVEIERLDKDLGAGLELGLTSLELFLLRQNVDVPAGELRGETHVLPAAADGQ